jgi:hypothetical protein
VSSDAQLFFFAAGGPSGVQTLNAFRDQPLTMADLLPFGPVFGVDASASQEARVWAFPNSRATRQRWSRLNTGDTGLGYAQRVFRVASTLQATAFSRELGRQLFGADRDYALLALFFDATPCAIDSWQIAQALDYDDDFFPRAGLFLPAPRHQALIRRQHDSPEELVGQLISNPAPRRRRRRQRPSAAGSPPRDRGAAVDDRRTNVDGLEVVELLEHAQRSAPLTRARLDAPSVVELNQPFQVVAGLGITPDAETLQVLDSSSLDAANTFEVQVIADGFHLGQGDWKQRLVRTDVDPYPTFALTLHATDSSQDRHSLIQALFSINGATVGLAARLIRVRRPGDTTSPPAPPQFPGGSVSLPDGVTPDLTVRITLSPISDARLLWSYSTPWEVDVPSEPSPSSIGARPDEFAAQLIAGVPSHEGRADLTLFLRGVGRTIRDIMPTSFWNAYRDVIASRKGKGRPSVLFLSEEPYIPWELALADHVTSEPVFLGCHAAVGRWVLRPNSDSVMPPAIAAQKPLAVVVGNYSGADALPGAVQEAHDLERLYGAVRVRARLDRLLACFEGRPPARILHFALHGVWAPGSGEDGLYLEDGQYLEPFVIRGASLSGVPLVFLNACEVGTGAQVLGSYGGTAEAFIAAGASGVIAPLWTVDDDEAREIALGFYSETFGGTPAGEAMAELRSRFDEASTVATAIAYQYFGHPLLRLPVG